MFSLTIANNSLIIPGSFELPGNSWFKSLTHVWHKSLQTIVTAEWTDDQCMKRIAAGEEKPFQCLFERYGDLVFGYCVKLLKDRDRAEDASQDVWVKVIRNAGKYKSEGKFRAWVLQIARNTCFSLFREMKHPYLGISTNKAFRIMLVLNIEPWHNGRFTCGIVQT